MQITKCPNYTRNFVLPISLNLEQPQPPEEEINVGGIAHPPLDLLHNKFVAVNGSNNEQYFLGNGFDALVSKSLIHSFGFESKNHITYVLIESIQHMLQYISRSHSTMHDGISLVTSNVDYLIKSTEHIRPLNSSFSLVNVNG